MPNVLAAKVIAAHGLKGEVRVRLFLSRASRLSEYGTLHARDGRAFKVAAVREAKAGEAILTFSDITGREGAEGLKSLELLIPREALPALDEGEYYHADLIGLSAYDAEDRLLGRVATVHNFGAGDVIEIARDDGNTILLSFTSANVPLVDLEAKRLVVAVPDEVEAKTP
jgi:16S rRNA processing protein RimM